jgi:haloalkane dehalogenase
MRSPWVRRAVLSVSVVLGVWVVLWHRSGGWVASDAIAVPPGAFTDDGFSGQKTIAALPSGLVAYLDVGQGPLLVLLHGCPFSAFEWQAVLPALSAHHRVVVPDLFGLGDTPVRLNDDFRLPRDAQMVRELVGHLGFAHASFIAHDHGGATLQVLMQLAPALIDRAVLTNAEAYDQWPSAPELPYLEAIVNPVTSPLVFAALQFEAAQREIFSIAVFNPKVLTPQVLRGWARPHTASASRWQRLRRFYRSQLNPEHRRATQEAVPAMRAFEQPVLLLWGARDENFGAAIAERLARDIAGVRGVHWLEASAHLPMQEEPERYSAAVLAFIDTIR